MTKSKKGTRRAALVGVGGLLLWWLLGRGSALATGRNVAKHAHGCRLRLSADGLSVNGEPADVPTAVARCEREQRAELEVTGDSRWGDYRALVDALHQAGIRPIGRPS